MPDSHPILNLPPSFGALAGIIIGRMLPGSWRPTQDVGVADASGSFC
jgi:hypothetical protein